MSILPSMSPILIMIVMVVIGLIVSRKAFYHPSIQAFIMFIVVTFALPGVIFKGIFSLTITESMAYDFRILLISGFALASSGVAIGYILARLCRMPSNESKQLAAFCGFGNTGFIGIPFIAEILGESSGAYAAYLDVATMLTVFTLGTLLLQRERFTLKQVKSFANAPFITVILSSALLFTGTTPPAFVLELSTVFASLSAPLAMLYIGMLIGDFRLQREKIESDVSIRGAVSIIVSVKLLVLPAVMWVVLSFVELSVELQQVLFLQASMPSFLLGAVLIRRHGGNSRMAVTAIVYTLLVFFILSPLYLYLVLRIL